MEGERETPVGGISAPLDAAVRALADLDPTMLDAGDAASLAVVLRRQIDRLEGVHAAVLAAVDDGDEWRASGAPSLAAWMSRQTAMQPGRVRAGVRLGRAMRSCRPLDRAVRSGVLAPTAAAAVVPAMGDDGFDAVAARLVDEVSGMTPTEAERHVEAWRATIDGRDDDRRRSDAHEARYLRFRPAGDGMERIEGMLPSETCRSLRLALAHLAEQQRRDGSDRDARQRRADAFGDLVAAFDRGEITGGRNLPRLIVTMTLDDLEQRRPGRASTGDVVSSSEIERLCCDAMIHRYVADQRGAVIDFGRGRRTVSPQQFLALVARDRGCRGPECDRPAGWCEAHHLREFAARGGLTNLDELVLFCHHHHHLVHEGRWTVTGDPARLIFTRPDGQVQHSLLPRHEVAMAA